MTPPPTHPPTVTVEPALEPTPHRAHTAEATPPNDWDGLQVKIDAKMLLRLTETMRPELAELMQMPLDDLETHLDGVGPDFFEISLDFVSGKTTFYIRDPGLPKEIFARYKHKNPSVNRGDQYALLNFLLKGADEEGVNLFIEATRDGEVVGPPTGVLVGEAVDP